VLDIFPTCHSARKGFRAVLFFSIIVAAAVFLRLYGLGSESFWVDEVFSALIVEEPIGTILDRIPNDKPPLDYYLQALAHPLGRPEVSHRIPAVIASLFTIAGVWFWARQVFGRRAACLAGMLAAFHFAVLHYAQEARPYSLLMALSVWQQGLFLAWWRRVTHIRPVSKSSLSHWPLLAGLCLLNLLLLFTMYSGIIILSMEMLLLLAAPGLILSDGHRTPHAIHTTESTVMPCREDRFSGIRRHVPFLLFALSFALALAPAMLALWSRTSITPPDDYFWRFEDMNLHRMLSLPAHAIITTVRFLPTLAAALASLLLMSLGLYRAWRLNRGAAVHLFLGSVLPLFLLPVFYALIDRQYYTPRYSIFCIPGCCILFALGIQKIGLIVVQRSARSRRRTPLAARPIVVALTGIMVLTSAGADMAARPRRPDWRGAAHYVAGKFEPGDLIVVPGYLEMVCMQYYMRRFSDQTPEVLTQNEFDARTDISGRVWMIALLLGKHDNHTRFHMVDVELQRAQSREPDMAPLMSALGDPPTLLMSEAPSELLGEGWSLPEVWNPETTIRWAVRRHAVVFMPLATSGPGRLVIPVYVPNWEDLPDQTVSVRINGRALEERTISKGLWTTLEWSVPAGHIKAGMNEITLEFGWIHSPSEFKKNYGDFRNLAAALRNVQFIHDAPTSQTAFGEHAFRKTGENEGDGGRNK